MLRPILVLAAAALLPSSPSAEAAAGSLPAGGPPLLHAQPPRAPELANRPPFRAAPLLVSGTDALRRGEYVYQDYLLDDRGADTRPVGTLTDPTREEPTSTGDIAASATGDVRYPTAERYAGNAADIAELRVRPSRRALVFRVTLRTAVAADAAVVGIGIDADRSGGAPVAWPLGAGVSSPGLDHFVTAWGTGGELRTGDGEPVPLRVRMDLARNQMTIRVPLAPGAATWRLVAGAGLWDRDAGAWLPVPAGTTPGEAVGASGSPERAAPAVMNLAFRFDERVAKAPDGTSTTFPGQGIWWEDGQAKALAAGTSRRFAADVDFGALARGARRFVHPPGPLQARVLASGLRVHEGVRTEYPEVGSRLIPYLLYRPDATRGGPAPLTFALHSFGGNYMQHAVFSPNQLVQFGDDRGSVVVTPSSRSLGGGYENESEADVFEVWRDVGRRVALDPARTAITGYSMGGFGAFRLASAYPDLFARAFTGVGPPGTGFEANVRWVPFLNWVAVGDELVTYPRALAAHARMEAAGLRSQLWSFGGEHFTIAIQDEWGAARDFLGDARAQRRPWHVSYGFDPADARRDLGLARAGAYWVRGLRARDPEQPASVDARSLATGARDPQVVEVDGSRTGLGGYPVTVLEGDGVPSPTLDIRGRAWEPAPREAGQQVVELTLANLRRARIGPRGARVPGRFELRVTSDGPATVAVRGRRPCRIPAAGTTRCRTHPDLPQR